MRKNCLTICFVIIALGNRGSAQEPLANENLRGLYVKSIEQAIRLQPEEIDIGTAALIVSEQWSNIVAGRRYQARLNEMATEIRSRCREKGIVAHTRIISIINDYLFSELRFGTVSEAEDPEDLFLHSVMDKNRGYCLSLSILYLAIGERLGLPLYGVVVPGHFFVRYDDGQTRFNIETTSKGANPPDSYYIEKFKVPQDRPNNIYMTNLNKRQTLGCLFNNFGNVYSDSGNRGQAMEALELAVYINPWLAESRTNLGNIYLEKNRIKDAVEQYLGALKINPNDAKVHSNLGNAYLRQERINDAIGQYSQSIRLEPNFVDGYRCLAIAYCRQEQYTKARLVLADAIAIEPGNATLHCALGDVHSQTGDCEQAITQYNRALKIKRDIAEAYCGLGVCYGKLGRAAEQMEAYNKAIEINPKLIQAIANLADAHFKQHDYTRAIDYYRRAIEIEPDESILYYNLGSAYSNKEDYKHAEEAYEKAVEIEPTMGDAHHRLAYVYYQLKKFDLAAKHVKEAQELGVQVDKDLLKGVEQAR